MPEALTERFWTGAGAQGDGTPGLEQTLRAAYEAGQAAWPDVALEAGDFAEFLGQKAGPSGAAQLPELRGADLYLACALERSVPSAVRRLEQLIRADLPAVIAAAPALASQGDDLQQALLERLLVPRSDQPRARIAEYSGRGSLRGWVRVSLTRLALNLASRGPKERPVSDDEGLLEPSGPAPDPELEQMRRLYRDDFKAVLREAIGSLSAHERNLLRHRYLDGLQVDGIAAIYGVHRVTAARQLAKARGNLLERLRAQVAEKWNLSTSEASSMARLMRSDLNLSLRNAFGTSSDREPSR